MKILRNSQEVLRIWPLKTKVLDSISRQDGRDQARGLGLET